jgi:hypothetical protein
VLPAGSPSALGLGKGLARARRRDSLGVDRILIDSQHVGVLEISEVGRVEIPQIGTEDER